MDETLTKKMHTTHKLHSIGNTELHQGAFDAWWRKAEDQSTLISDIIKKSGSF